MAIVPGSKLNLAALPIRLASACASRAASPMTCRRSSGTSTSRRCRPALSRSWLWATAAWTMLSIETCSRTSEIWPWAARVTSISSSTSRPSRPTCRSRISRSRTRIGLLCSRVRRTLAALAIGASGIAQLVREHRQELALAPLGQAQRLGPLGQGLLEHLALVDLDRAADEAVGRAPGIAQHRAVVDEPAVLAVVPAQAQVEGERGLRLEAGGADAEAALEVLGMDEPGPAVAAQLAGRAPL